MLRGFDPILDDRFELFGCHPCMRGHRHFHEALFTCSKYRFKIPLQYCGKGEPVFPVALFRSHALDAIQNKIRLEIHGLF